MIFEGLLNAIPGQGVKCVGDVQGHPHDHPALPHGLFRQAADAKYGVHRTPCPAKSKLPLVQVGAHLFEMLDESASNNSLQ